MNADRFRAALKLVHRKLTDDEFIYGLVGRQNPSGSPSFDVKGRKNYIYVRLRQSNGAQTVVPARNDARVEKSYGLSVKMRLEGTTYVIKEVAGREDLASLPSAPSSGVPIHEHSALYYQKTEFINASTGVADAGKPVKTDAGGLLDASLIDPEDIADIVGTMVTGNTETDIAVTYDDADNTLDFVVSPTLVADRISAASTDDTIVDADLWGYVTGGVLVKTAWSNIKATLKTYFDTLYDLLATANTWVQNQTIASTQTTGNSLNVTRNLASTSTDAPVVSIVQDHASDDQTALRVQQDGTGSVVNFLAAATSILNVGLTDVTAGKFLTLTANSATISGGVITATGTMMVVDTEALAASDDLDTINGGSADRILLIRSLNSGRDVVLKNATGNLRMANSVDFALSNRRCFAVGFYHASDATWNLVGFTIN